jgi:hypothetical protein
MIEKVYGKECSQEAVNDCILPLIRGGQGAGIEPFDAADIEGSICR